MECQTPSEKPIPRQPTIAFAAATAWSRLRVCDWADPSEAPAGQRANLGRAACHPDGSNWLPVARVWIPNEFRKAMIQAWIKLLLKLGMDTDITTDYVQS